MAKMSEAFIEPMSDAQMREQSKEYLIHLIRQLRAETTSYRNRMTEGHPNANLLQKVLCERQVCEDKIDKMKAKIKSLNKQLRLVDER